MIKIKSSKNRISFLILHLKIKWYMQINKNLLLSFTTLLMSKDISHLNCYSSLMIKNIHSKRRLKSSRKSYLRWTKLKTKNCKWWKNRNILFIIWGSISLQKLWVLQCKLMCQWNSSDRYLNRRIQEELLHKK